MTYRDNKSRFVSVVQLWRLVALLLLFGIVIPPRARGFDDSPQSASDRTDAPRPAPALPIVPQPEAHILITGELLGYLRLPDQQDGTKPEAEEICPRRDQATGVAKQFLKITPGNEAERAKARTVLVSMGNIFAPNYFSRVFNPAPQRATSISKYLHSKELFEWDWDPVNGETANGKPGWVLAKELKEEREGGRVWPLIKQGKGFIPMDNVGCFLDAAGFDAIVPGKHDFFFGPEHLRHLARFLATPRAVDHQEAVQMLAANLVIKTKYAPEKKVLTDAERHVEDVYTPQDETLKPGNFSRHILPWLPSLQFKWDRDPTQLDARLCIAKKDDPSSLEKGKIEDCPKMVKQNIKRDEGETQYTFNLTPAGGPFAVGGNYLTCFLRQPAKKNYCVRFTVDSPFFLYPNPKLKRINEDGQLYNDPEPYVWKCLANAAGNSIPIIKSGDCPIDRTEVAIFGVVDTDLKEHIGQLNYSWLNETKKTKFKTEIDVMDPADALKQLLQRLHADHPNFHGIKVLLAQMPAPRAQQLAAGFGGEFNVIIAAADAQQITPTGSFTFDAPPPQEPDEKSNAPRLLVVPPPFYHFVEKATVSKLRTVDVSQSATGEWTLHSSDKSLSLPKEEMIVKTKWFQERVADGLRKVLHLKPSETLPDNYRKDPKAAFTDYVLRVMKETAHADAALIQRRDFSFKATLTPEESEAPRKDFQVALERILWKGDFIVKRTLPGSALKTVLKTSKDFESQDALSLSISNERNRGLVTIGATLDAERDEYLINGEPLDDKRLYTVAITDYAGLGDTGYPELNTASVAGPTLPREFHYLCPLVMVMDRAASSADGDYDKPDCDKLFKASEYLDALEGTPSDRKVVGYSEQVERWVRFTSDRATDPWSGMTKLEKSVQLRPVWFFSLGKASAGLSAVRNNENEAARQTDFAGVNVPQVQTAKSSIVNFASQARSGIAGSSVDWFASYDLAHARTSTGQATSPRLLNFSDNRLVYESGVFFHLREKRFPHFGPQVSVRYETQLFRPFETLQLKDTSTTPAGISSLTFQRQRTRNIQYPRAGFRWQNRQSSFQFGYEYANVQRVTGYNFADPNTRALTATCPVSQPGNPRALSDCLTAGNTVRPQTITSKSLASVILSKVNRNGIYFSGKLVIPATSHVSFVSDHDFELFFSEKGDVASMTYWRYLTTQSLQLKIVDNLSASPTFATFFYENQPAGNPGNQHFFRQFKSSIDLTYSFDWFRGNPGKVTRYKKPDK